MGDASVEAGDMVATVVHDLKNPLNAILMSASLIERTTEDEAILRQAQVIQRSAERMNRLVLDLLEQAALDAGRLPMRRSRYDVMELLREAIDGLQPVAAGKGILLVLVRCDRCWVDCDRERIQQILSNLVGNALKFTPPGGRIELGARLAAPDRVELSVSDTGTGIPPEEQPHVFERFWRGRDGNTGLGLSIARGIVEAHGGRIVLESAPGAGATFRFTLPGGEDERAEVNP